MPSVPTRLGEDLALAELLGQRDGLARPLHRRLAIPIEHAQLRLDAVGARQLGAGAAAPEHLDRLLARRVGLRVAQREHLGKRQSAEVDRLAPRVGVRLVPRGQLAVRGDRGVQLVREAALARTGGQPVADVVAALAMRQRRAEMRRRLQCAPRCCAWRAASGASVATARASPARTA